ncbi:hypothetical protein WMY93_032977 [Mugilogobius chulae]|uniref:Uncharacterized protein n=1 Tax=Mugilogobius chulae TaxID=88201 RepID=A0AAW0MT93_9GOBI
MSDRPNVTRPVPRAAVLNAIRKLHVGRVGEDGSVTMDDEGGPKTRGEDDWTATLRTRLRSSPSPSQSERNVTLLRSEKNPAE